MKNGLILFPRSTAGRGSQAFGWWREAAAQNGLSVEIAFFEDAVLEYGAGRSDVIIQGCTLSPDFVVMRGYNPELSLHFESKHIRTFNSWNSMMLSRDKVLTHQRLSSCGIAMPRTVRAFEGLSYTKAVELIGSGVFILKATQGSCGENVYLVHNAEEYECAVSNCPEDFLVQEFIEASIGRDVRVWTIGGVAVAAVMRRSNDDFRSNYSCGGFAEPVVITDEIAALAEAASKTLGLDFAGVDILLGEHGPCVCEVNGNAGFRTLSAVGGPDILNLFFKYVAKEVYGND